MSERTRAHQWRVGVKSWKCPICIEPFADPLITRWSDWDLDLAVRAHTQVFHDVLIILPMKEPFNHEAFSKALIDSLLKKTFT